MRWSLCGIALALFAPISAAEAQTPASAVPAQHDVATPGTVGRTVIASMPALCLTGKDMDDARAKSMVARLYAYSLALQIATDGDPFILYKNLEKLAGPGSEWDLCLQTQVLAAGPAQPFSARTIGPFEAIQVKCTGPRLDEAPCLDLLSAWLKDHQARPVGAPRERVISAADASVSATVTEITVPIESLPESPPSPSPPPSPPSA